MVNQITSCYKASSMHGDHLNTLKVDIQGLTHEQHILVIVWGSKLFKLFRFKPTSLVCVFVNVKVVVVQHGVASGLGRLDQSGNRRLCGYVCMGVNDGIYDHRFVVCMHAQDTALFDKFCGISDMLGHS